MRVKSNSNAFTVPKAWKNIMSSIVINVGLQGKIGGPVAHTNRQKHTVSLSEENGGSMSRVIKHTDRIYSSCVRMLTVSEEAVSSWINDDCPHWESAKDWRKMTDLQRIRSHVDRFDEGFGVDFEIIG